MSEKFRQYLSGDLVQPTRHIASVPAGTGRVVDEVKEDGCLYLNDLQGRPAGHYCEEASVKVAPPDVGTLVRVRGSNLLAKVIAVGHFIQLEGGHAGSWARELWGVELFPVHSHLRDLVVGKALKTVGVEAPTPKVDVPQLARILFTRDHGAEAALRGEEGMPGGIGRAAALRVMWKADPARAARYLAMAKGLVDAYVGVALP